MILALSNLNSLWFREKSIKWKDSNEDGDTAVDEVGNEKIGSYKYLTS